MAKESQLQQCRSAQDKQTDGCNDDHYALIGLYILAVGGLLCWLCSCSAEQRMESETYNRHTEQAVQRMDSLVHAVMTWQQRVYEKQTAATDTFRHLEVRDTSRTYYLGAHGDTIREKTVVYVERNTSQSSKESTTERLEERLVRTDSMLQVSLDRQEKLERLLRDREKTAVVEKNPPWYQRLLPTYSIFMTLAVAVLWLMWKKKIPRHSK